MKELTKEMFLAGVKFKICGIVYKYYQEKVHCLVFDATLETYECKVFENHFECQHIFLDEIITKKIKFSDCTIAENEG